MDQHPIFIKYTRDWLADVTGFSKGYLSRLATGRVPVSRSFIERISYKLGKSESELFLPDAVESGDSAETVAARAEGS